MYISNQIKWNLLTQKGQLATNNAKNEDNVKVIKTVLQSYKTKHIISTEHIKTIQRYKKYKKYYKFRMMMMTMMKN